MTRMLWMVGGVLAGLVVASPADAQILGTFRWQFAPYCNVVTVLVEQKAGRYELTGTENGCAPAAPAAAANGSAHVNVDGTVGLALAIVRPDGHTVNTFATISSATFAGTWRDDWGNNGAFIFSPPAAPAGTARPLTMTGDWAAIFPGSNNNQGAGAVSFPRPLATAPVPHVMAVDAAPTAQCPGTVDNPQAAPGHLCVYRLVSAWVGALSVMSGATGNPGTASRSGFIAVATVGGASPGGTTYVYGRWAVSVP